MSDRHSLLGRHVMETVAVSYLFFFALFHAGTAASSNDDSMVIMQRFQRPRLHNSRDAWRFLGFPALRSTPKKLCTTLPCSLSRPLSIHNKQFMVDHGQDD